MQFVGHKVLNGQKHCPKVKKRVSACKATSGHERGAKLCNWSEGGVANDQIGKRSIPPPQPFESSAERGQNLEVSERQEVDANRLCILGRPRL